VSPEAPGAGNRRAAEAKLQVLVGSVKEALLADPDFWLQLADKMEEK